MKSRTPKFLNDENAEHKVFLSLAQNAQWLLTQENLCLESGELRKRYYNLLLRAGFAYYNGRIKNSKLLKAFNEYFPSIALEELGCSIESTHRSWVLRLTEKGKADVLHHPIRHLLLLDFLNISAEEFFTSFVEFKPFGDGPYACLNKSSEHFGKLRIPEYQLFDNISKDKNRSGRPLGVFACDCGFVYQRVGPDSTEQDRFTFSLVREYGEIWENKLKELWMDLTLSTTKIGTLLGISQVSVVRHAIRLNLPMNTSDSRIVRGYTRHRNPNKSFSEMRTQYQQEWLKIIEENSELSRQELMDISNFHYLWLRRNDSDWLEAHLPSPVKVPRKMEHLDWKKIDEELSRQINEVCENLLSSKERPQRICITEIIRRVGYKKWIEKRNKKLPQTTKILDKYLESLEDYMIRKLRWAENEFTKEREVPSRNQLIRRAVIENTTTKNSVRIQNEIDKSLMRIIKEIEEN